MKTASNILFLLPFFLVLSTVFILNRELAYDVISGKYFWFYGCMGIIMLSTPIYFFVSRIHVKWSLTDIVVLLFGILGVTVTYLRNDAATTKLVLFVLICLLYFYFRVALSANKRNVEWLLLFFILTGCVEAIWGLKQLYGYSPSQHNLFKTTGSFFNPGPYAGYLAMTFPAAFYYVLADYAVLGKRFTKTSAFSYVRWIISVITVIAILLILPATMSRASWLGAIAGCLVVGGCFFTEKYGLTSYFRKHKKKILSVLGICVIVFLIGIFGIYHVKKNSADGRVLMWKTTLQAIPHHPLGVGLGNFAGTYGSEQAAYFASGKGSGQEEFVAGSPEYAFNEFLQIGLEIGVIGLALFTLILILSFYQGYKQRQFPSIASLTALPVFACMSYPFSVLPFLIALVFLLAGCNMTTDEMPAISTKRVRDERVRGELKNRRSQIFLSEEIKRMKPILPILFFLLSATIIFLCLFNRYPTYNAYKKWNTTKLLFGMKQYERIENDYADMYPYLKDQLNFLFEYGQILSNTGKYEEGNNILTQATKISGDPMLYNIIGKNYQSLNNYYLAEQNFIKASYIVPHRIYPHYLLMKMYMESENETKAKTKAEKILNMQPKVNSPAIEEMKGEAKKLKVKD